jgi:excisionase family DNA binding protein
MDDEILTVAETAKYLRINPASVYRLIEQGSLRPLRVGRVIRLTRSEIARWMDEQLAGVASGDR